MRQSPSSGRKLLKRGAKFVQLRLIDTQPDRVTGSMPLVQLYGTVLEDCQALIDRDRTTTDSIPDEDAGVFALIDALLRHRPRSIPCLARVDTRVGKSSTSPDTPAGTRVRSLRVPVGSLADRRGWSRISAIRSAQCRAMT